MPQSLGLVAGVGRWCVDHPPRVLGLRGLPGLAHPRGVDEAPFVVRSLLLPAVLELLGRRTWWFPKRLARRLPHLATEPAARRTVEPTEAA
jgi:hypothetical protein